MLWWLFNNEGGEDGRGKANKIGGTEGIDFSLLHTFVKFSSWLCHKGQQSDEKLPWNNVREHESYREVGEMRWQAERY